MVIKKLGPALLPEFLEVVTFLATQRRMSVIVEPAVLQEVFSGGRNSQLAEYVYTWSAEDNNK